MNAKNNEKLMELMCAAVDIKEKMRALYREAAGKCSDSIGTDTFNMLEGMEREHIVRLHQLQKDLAAGGAGFDSCRMYDFDSPGKKEVTKRIARERRTLSAACLDDVAAIQSGMDLENKGINFFTDQLKQASSPSEREVLNHLIAEERAHYIMLADLRFYYIDPEHWFMEKGRTDLDGAGAVS